MLKADLHIHTRASDGLLTSAEVVEQARLSSLDVIAITDHDTIDGLQEARQAGNDLGIKVINGVEISTIFRGRECHLLAYAFEDLDRMQSLLALQKIRRKQRMRNIVGNLNRLGFDIRYDEVLAEAGMGTVGRPHIANVMVKKGYAADHSEVFFRFLGENSRAYYRIDYPEAGDAIRHIHRSGGFAVLAHPAGNYTFIDLKELKESGLDGIECYHPSHHPRQRERYLEYCSLVDLIVTGGSDFHGKNHDYFHMKAIPVHLDPASPLLKSNASRLASEQKTGSRRLKTGSGGVRLCAGC